MKDQIKRIDKAIYAVERAFVVVALAVMSIVVFLDVVHRTFGSDESKGVAAIVKLLSYFGKILEPGSAGYASLEVWTPYILWPAFIALGYLAFRTATRGTLPHARALIYGALSIAATYGLIQLFVKLVPNGLIWSQPLALVLTLWVGFIAASMCTYEVKHLKVEAAQRVIPPKLKPAVFVVSSLFTAFVCICLGWLSARYVAFNYEEYVITEGQGGLFSGFEVPKYQGFLVLPVSFGLMTIRFVLRAVWAIGGEVPESTMEGMEELERLASTPESEIETQGVGASPRGSKPRPSNLPPPSEVPTETVSVRDDRDASSGDAALPQSQVPTEPHDVAPDSDLDHAADPAAKDDDDPVAGDDADVPAASDHDEERP